MSIRVSQESRVRRITLAAPEKKNLLDAAAAVQLIEALRAAAADPAVGAVLLDAEGPVFCSGVSPEARDGLFSIGQRFAKPMVAAVQGVALSGGVALLANSHVVLAAQGSSFGLLGIRDGIWDEPVYRSVAAAIGERRALELCLTGRIFTVPDALAWGLVHMVAPAFELAERAEETALRLSQMPADVLHAALNPR